MTSTAAAGPARSPAGRIRNTGILILAVLAAFLWFEPPWMMRLQATWFDAYQARTPREIESLPVVIVDIDDRSIAALGQWPWPRTALARLIREIARSKPLAIGVDFVMTERDRLSPERLLDRAGLVDPAFAARIEALPTNDSELAGAFETAPVVLSLVGKSNGAGDVLRAAPIMVRDVSPGAPPSRPDVMTFAGIFGNLDELDRAAAGRGLISTSTPDGVVRRIPLVFDIGGTLAPSLALEMLRVAEGAPALRMSTRGTAVSAITVGPWTVRTERDGSLRPYYSRSSTKRYVSAIDVFAGKVKPDRFENRLVLIGVTGIGLVDNQNTPLRETMFGTEVQAQLIENLLEGTWLERPPWAHALELATFILLGALLIWATPRWSPRDSVLLATGCIVLPALGGYVAFRTQRWLLDAASPAIGLGVLFVVLLLLTLREATRTRKSLERQVSASRENAARVAGEFEAAQRIQVGMLPPADLLRDDPRVELAAAMTPAREVGGDLYDYFRLDDRRLFFLIGDVAGKGLSASIFMAVSKALYKSMALRLHESDVGVLMSAANVEVSRDNPESLFVTAFAGILDLATGDLTYCNAGHENPYVISAGNGAIARIEDGDGPPLCAIDDYAYRGGDRRLQRGDVLCLVTDGVTDASDPSGEAFGGRRTLACLSRYAGKHPSAREIVDALRTEVAAHARGAEAADDLTVLALRWNG